MPSGEGPPSPVRLEEMKVDLTAQTGVKPVTAPAEDLAAEFGATPSAPPEITTPPEASTPEVALSPDNGKELTAAERAAEAPIVVVVSEFQAAALAFPDDAHPAEIAAGFLNNQSLVSGGDVVASDGQTVHTVGIFGAERRAIETRLRSIVRARQTLVDAKGAHDERIRVPLLGQVLRDSGEVTKAEAERRALVQEYNQKVGNGQKRIETQERQIENYCKTEGIRPAHREKYNHWVAIESFLETTEPSSKDLTPVQEHIDALGLGNVASSREKLGELVAVAKSMGLGYDGYRNLVIGYYQDGVHVDGLQDYQRNVDQVKAEYADSLEQAKAAVARAKRKADQWERVATRLKERYSPEERALDAQLETINRVEAYLEENYAPDADKIAQFQTDIATLVKKRHEAYEHGALAAQFIDETVGPGKGDSVRREMIKGQRINVKEVEEQRRKFHGLTDPQARLSQKGAPKELVAAVQMVFAADFDIEAVPSDQRVLAEASMVLLGKGQVKIAEGRPAPSVTPAEEVVPAEASEAAAAGGEEPEIVITEEEVPPVIETAKGVPADLASATVEQLTSVASQLTSEQLNQLPAGAVAELARGEHLTAEQLASLSVDEEAGNINEQLLRWAEDKPEEGGKLIQASIDAAEKGDAQGGLSRENDIPRLINEALRRVADVVHQDLPKAANRPFRVNEVREQLTKLTKSGKPEAAKRAQDALKMLGVATLAMGFLGTSAGKAEEG